MTVLLSALLLALALQADALAAGGEGAETSETQESPPVPPVPLETPQATVEGVEEAGAEVSEGVGGAGGELVPETPVPETPVEPQPVVPPVEEAPPPPAPEGSEEAHAPPPAEGGEAAGGATGHGEGSESAAGGGSSEAPGQAKGAGASEEAGAGAPPRSTLLEATAAEGASHLGAAAGEVMPPTDATVTAKVAEVSEQQASGRRGHRAGVAIGAQAGSFSCELSALSGKTTDNCTAGWLGAAREPVAPATSTAVAAIASLIVDSTAGAPPGGHGGSSAGGPPLTPAPAPAPGGASGAATGGGAPAGGVSIFLTLAGLLLLGAPRAMRRLGLSFEPWLAGCFVLIPEHPD